MILTTHSPQETESIAGWMAQNLPPTAIALVGDLGMGKTCFAKGFLESLGVNKDEVSSPTFAIVHEYDASPPVLHLDIYRLEEADLPNLGLDERIDEHIGFESGFVLVEWANKHSSLLPPDTVWVHFSAEEDRRILRLDASEETLDLLKSKLDQLKTVRL